MNEDVVLTDPWEDLRNPDGEHRERVSGLETEVRTELSDGHPLFGRDFSIVGHSHVADDVLVKWTKGGFSCTSLGVNTQSSHHGPPARSSVWLATSNKP